MTVQVHGRCAAATAAVRHPHAGRRGGWPGRRRDRPEGPDVGPESGYAESWRNSLGGPQSGPLEGARGVEVRDPVTGRLITDIDLVENGVLWEEKSAVFATDIAKWVRKHI